MPETTLKQDHYAILVADLIYLLFTTISYSTSEWTDSPIPGAAGCSVKAGLWRKCFDGCGATSGCTDLTSSEVNNDVKAARGLILVAILLTPVVMFMAYKNSTGKYISCKMSSFGKSMTKVKGTKGGSWGDVMLRVVILIFGVAGGLSVISDYIPIKSGGPDAGYSLILWATAQALYVVLILIQIAGNCITIGLCGKQTSDLPVSAGNVEGALNY